MAFIDTTDDFDEAIADADIIIIQVDDNGHPSTLKSKDPILRQISNTPYFRNLNLATMGHSFTKKDNTKIAIWGCKRYYKRHDGDICDPFIDLIKVIAELVTSDKRLPFRKPVDEIFTQHPNDASGRIVICGELSDIDLSIIEKAFSKWDGTIILVNTKYPIKSKENQ